MQCEIVCGFEKNLLYIYILTFDIYIIYFMIINIYIYYNIKINFIIIYTMFELFWCIVCRRVHCPEHWCALDTTSVGETSFS